MESAAVRELDPQSDVADDPYYDEDEEDGVLHELTSRGKVGGA